MEKFSEFLTRMMPQQAQPQMQPMPAAGGGRIGGGGGFINNNEPPNPPGDDNNNYNDKSDYNKYNDQILKKIAIKIGSDSSEFKPLLRYIAKNQIAYNLFQKLIDKTSTASASKFGNILKRNTN